MKIILLKDYKGVGKKGEVKEVKDGFGRNFLIPNGIAVVADSKNLSKLNSERETRARQKEAERKKIEEIKAKLDGTVLKTTLKSGENGEPFGSVPANDIVHLLKEKGIEIEKNQVFLEKPLKTFGMHEVNIDLGNGVNVTAQIEIDSDFS